MNNEFQLSVNITLTLSVLFLQFDLVNTIGEAAALGAAGIISWGDMNVTDTEVDCTFDRKLVAFRYLSCKTSIITF